MPFDLKMPSPIKQSVAIKSATLVETEPDAQTTTRHTEKLCPTIAHLAHISVLRI